MLLKNVDIHIFTEHPPDPTCAADYVVLAAVVLAESLLAFTIVYSIRHRADPLIKLRKPWILSLLCLGGMVHIAAAFVSGAYLNGAAWVDAVRNCWCPLWDFWLKFAAGINLWFCAEACYLLDWFITVRWKLRPGMVRARTRWWHVLLQMASQVAMLSAPIVTLCVAVSAAGGTRYDAATQWCTAGDGYKLALIAWLVGFSIVLLALCALMFPHRARAFIAYRASCGSVLVGLAILALMIVLNYYALETTWWGRALSMFTLIAFYAISLAWFLLMDLIDHKLLSRDDESALTRELADSLHASTNTRMTLDNVMAISATRDDFLRSVASEARNSLRLLHPERLDSDDIVDLQLPALPVMQENEGVVRMKHEAPPEGGFYMIGADVAALRVDFDEYRNELAIYRRSGSENSMMLPGLSERLLALVQRHFVAWDTPDTETPMPPRAVGIVQGDEHAWDFADADKCVFKQVSAANGLYERLQAYQKVDLRVDRIVWRYRLRYHTVFLPERVLCALYTYAGQRQPLATEVEMALGRAIYRSLHCFFYMYSRQSANRDFFNRTCMKHIYETMDLPEVCTVVDDASDAFSYSTAPNASFTIADEDDDDL